MVKRRDRAVSGMAGFDGAGQIAIRKIPIEVRAEIPPEPQTFRWQPTFPSLALRRAGQLH